MRISRLLMIVSLFLAIGIVGVAEDVPEGVVVYFIDVGQGDAILIDYGSYEVLIDGGRSCSFEDLMLSEVDGPLDLLVATHPDADHIGGLDEVLALFDVAEIWTNGATKDTQTYQDFDAAVNSELGAVIRVVTRGYRITVGDLEIEVLHPLGPDATNNGSIVLLVTYDTSTILLTGDIETPAESSLIAAGVLQDVDILKVAHHGSSNSSSLAFLEQVAPEIAIISVGEGNQYGHPSPATLEHLYCDEHATIYSTAINGTIMVLLRPGFDPVAGARVKTPITVSCTEPDCFTVTSIASLVINEVEMNPLGSDSGNEWIELYNTGDEAVSLNGWQISYTAYCGSGEGTCWEPPIFGDTIQPKSYYVYTFPKQHLNNANGWVIYLRDASGTIVDRTPGSQTDEHDDARTWQRVSDGDDEWEKRNGTRDLPN